jgi:hypothetical protein
VATKKKEQASKAKVLEQQAVEEVKTEVKEVWEGEKLDPGEEKVLDMILKGIVMFVLGWLALGVLLSVKGLIWPS